MALFLRPNSDVVLTFLQEVEDEDDVPESDNKIEEVEDDDSKKKKTKKVKEVEVENQELNKVRFFWACVDYVFILHFFRPSLCGHVTRKRSPPRSTLPSTRA